MLTQAKVLELARSPIRVNARTPGYFAIEPNSAFLAERPAR